MATDRDWAFGFLQQARADLAAVGALSLHGTMTSERASVIAMLLQMGFEKLGKAALLRSGAITYGAAERSHRAASRMVATMRLQRRLIAPIGGAGHWQAAFEVVEALEQAHPSVARGHRMLEYPWEATDGTIEWPARHLPIALKFANPKSTLAAHVVDFAFKLERNFNSIFP